MEQKLLTEKAINLLKELISIQSFSSEEDKTADAIENWFTSFNIPFTRDNNNVYAKNKHWDPSKPTLLLNSHHDTVKPNSAYTKDPFNPHIEDGKLYGLGSNDAGGCLVSLLATFVHYYNAENLNHNILMVASMEEESAGPNSLRGLLPKLPKIDVAIVGEPTLMQLAIAEKGLIVFDAEVKGTPSHAAHPNNDNSIYNTIKVLEWFKNYTFNKVSDVLGEVKLTVTQINAGKQHNVVPAKVDLVIDVRVNDKYTNKEVAEMLQKEAPCKITPRGLKLNSSAIDISHPLVQSGIALGRETYGSPTLSDQAALTCQSLKLGPGDSTRSHSADEFIYVNEIEEGIDLYIKILNGFLQ
ncbi:M20 family metallo-hydrolase [Cellulophaga lytica]|uniref:M20 family metallo-hydrolase n=1 Tax=Cellulophaga TaxID=104264 RepID=UPI0004F675E5|nr:MULTISPECIES: M20 family metallo-hydrolase [Cellulophaga]AIM59712.1 acetylornithine deacetylase [Cellulophaga lytica]APU09569.1 acetylornithine deacetylase [Cellulophaga lytica]MDO6853963.1 M20 family metallo-hydrolase [Cellulophaga lytica]TVZ08774.1 acetylornithine deacetylase [Cellulophaga sp. RHA_52]